ncbi:MAG: PorV/PorQ family protein, partial [Cyclobacteriaceae bacterium]
MKKLLFIAFLFPLLLIAQSGGSYSFQSLFLTNNARTAALGGYNVSLADGDASLFGQNPALLDSTRSGDVVFMYNPFFVDINAMTAQYVTEFGSLGKVGFGLTYIGYGDFHQTDATGAESGTFNARDYVMTIGKSHRLGPFVLGANLKFIHSGIAGFSANAVAMDLGGLYQLPRSNFSAGLVISNLGMVL